MKITTVGVDLAENVFQVHGIDEGGEVVVGKALRRRQLVPFFSKLEELVSLTHQKEGRICVIGPKSRRLPAGIETCAY